MNHEHKPAEKLHLLLFHHLFFIETVTVLLLEVICFVKLTLNTLTIVYLFKSCIFPVNASLKKVLPRNLTITPLICVLLLSAIMIALCYDIVF